MFRIDCADRDLSELLDPNQWVSSRWGGDSSQPCGGCVDCQADPRRRGESFWRCHGRRRVTDARYGVSVMVDEHDLVAYLAHTGAHLGNTVLVELEGAESGDEPHDEYFGELLILPTRIVGVRPVGEGFIAAVRNA